MAYNDQSFLQSLVYIPLPLYTLKRTRINERLWINYHLTNKLVTKQAVTGYKVTASTLLHPHLNPTPPELPIGDVKHALALTFPS